MIGMLHWKWDWLLDWKVKWMPFSPPPHTPSPLHTDEVLIEVDSEDIPEHLKARVAEEK